MIAVETIILILQIWTAVMLTGVVVLTIIRELSE